MPLSKPQKFAFPIYRLMTATLVIFVLFAILNYLNYLVSTSELDERAHQYNFALMIFSFFTLTAFYFVIFLPLLYRANHYFKDLAQANIKLDLQAQELKMTQRVMYSVLEDFQTSYEQARRSRDAAHHLAAIVESSSDAIIGKKLDGTIMSWNQGAERLYGYTMDEMIGKNISQLIPKHLPNEIPRIMKEIMGGRRVEQYDTIRVRKDGKLVDISLTVSPVANDKGELIGASAIARDITERKRADDVLRSVMADLAKSTAELKDANEKLEQLDRLKSNFIMMASHELRTPLSAVKGYISLILGEKAGKINQEQKEFLTHVHKATEKLQRLLSEMLNLSKIEAGQFTLNLTESLLAEMIKEEVETFQSQANSKEIRLELVIKNDLGKVFCDVDRMSEVMDNLISNAIKYTRRGGKIRVITERLPDHIQILIEDNGMGIPESECEKIFEPFYRVHRQGSEGEEASGLGLPLVKKIIEMHQGTISAKSSESGSVFTVILPI